MTTSSQILTGQTPPRSAMAPSCACPTPPPAACAALLSASGFPASRALSQCRERGGGGLGSRSGVYVSLVPPPPTPPHSLPGSDVRLLNISSSFEQIAAPVRSRSSNRCSFTVAFSGLLGMLCLPSIPLEEHSCNSAAHLRTHDQRTATCSQPCDSTEPFKA